MCRSRRELSNAYLLAKIGVDTAENEPLEVWGENSIHYSLHSLVITLSEHVLFSFLQLPPGAAGPKRGRGVFQAFLSDAPDIGSSLEAVGTHEMRTHGRGDTDRERVDGFPEFLHEHAHVREIRPHRNEGRWSNADIPGT